MVDIEMACWFMFVRPPGPLRLRLYLDPKGIVDSFPSPFTVQGCLLQAKMNLSID